MSNTHQVQAVFPGALNQAVREELAQNKSFSFSFGYDEVCWLGMINLKGIPGNDPYMDSVPEAIHEMFNALAFCQMDDFGNLVGRDPFTHHFEGYSSYLAPDYANPPKGDDEPYSYVLHYPTIH